MIVSERHTGGIPVVARRPRRHPVAFLAGAVAIMLAFGYTLGRTGPLTAFVAATGLAVIMAIVSNLGNQMDSH